MISRMRFLAAVALIAAGPFVAGVDLGEKGAEGTACEAASIDAWTHRDLLQ